MRIALRPSGGRGDYELAGSFGELHAADLLGKKFFFEIIPSLTIDGKASVKKLSGKTRIRPEGGRHAYLIVSAILLLPPPKRELLKTDVGLPKLRSGTYTIAGIDVDVLSNQQSKVIFGFSDLWLRSRGGVVKLDYAARMSLITAIWGAAKSSQAGVAALVLNHRASVKSGNHAQIIAAASAIQKHYQSEDDVLPLVLGDLQLPEATSLAYSGLSSLLGNDLGSEDDDSTAEESKRERARKWRKQADRGPGAREFSMRVREAYDYRCVFSGERFPKFSLIDSSGVDGAHILPWSTHQLNSVSNGLCLCKLCHWAFDAGLMNLDFDAATNDYVLSISHEVASGAVGANFDLAAFNKLTGPIDKARLPGNPKLWPSPKYIRAFNSAM